MIGQYDCKDDILRSYYDECKELLKEFWLVSLHHIPREQNQEVNKLAQSAFGYWENREAFAVDEYVFNTDDQAVNDWRIEIADYLRNPS